MDRATLNETTGLVITAALKVHSCLGPGLLESAYEACLAHELRRRGVRVAAQVALPVRYDGILVELGYRLDLLDEDSVVVELKSVRRISPLHHARVLSYMKLGGYRLGLLINFTELRLRDGIVRLANSC
jgi:GxxExxY protein